MDNTYDMNINDDTHFNIGFELKFNLEDMDFPRSRSLPTILIDYEEFAHVLENSPHVGSRERQTPKKDTTTGKIVSANTRFI